MFLVRDLPKYEAIRARAARYPEIDPEGLEAFLILMRTGSLVLMAVERYFYRYKMSHGSFCVLMVLFRNPEVGMNPSELATQCGVTRATMTGLLDGLQRKKLIRREKHQADRRTILIRLKDPAIGLLESLLHDYYKRVTRLMSDLPAQDKKHLSEMLQNVGTRVERFTEAVK